MSALWWKSKSCYRLIWVSASFSIEVKVITYHHRCRRYPDSLSLSLSLSLSRIFTSLLEYRSTSRTAWGIDFFFFTMAMDGATPPWQTPAKSCQPGPLIPRPGVEATPRQTGDGEGREGGGGRFGCPFPTVIRGFQALALRLGCLQPGRKLTGSRHGCQRKGVWLPASPELGTVRLQCFPVPSHWLVHCRTEWIGEGVEVEGGLGGGGGG